MDGGSIESKAALREHYGAPSEKSLRKQLARIDAHCRAFIARSPFLVIATAGADGLADASPRGDAPGFVAVLDDETLLLPDRRGNNRTDSLLNLIDNPAIGLLFFVPGLTETLRVNGHARITVDADLLAPLAAEGKAPRSGLLVTVREAYLQCGKALIRSKLWDPTRHVARGEIASPAKMLADHVGGSDEATVETELREAYETRLY